MSKKTIRCRDCNEEILKKYKYGMLQYPLCDDCKKERKKKDKILKKVNK